MYIYAIDHIYEGARLRGICFRGQLPRKQSPVATHLHKAPVQHATGHTTSVGPVDKCQLKCNHHTVHLPQPLV